MLPTLTHGDDTRLRHGFIELRDVDLWLRRWASELFPKATGAVKLSGHDL